MYITVDTSHHDLYRRLDALRGDKTVEQFALDWPSASGLRP